MKLKKITSMLLTAAVALTLSAAAFADESSASVDVAFDGTKFTVTGMEAVKTAAEDLLPGDSLTVTANLKNNAAEDTNWYMRNAIKDTFEKDASGNVVAKDGAYTYTLTYEGGGKTQTLYSSDMLGSLDAMGAALEDSFGLGTIAKGGSAKVTMKVELDGETQRNIYQEKDAAVVLEFAAEPVPVPETVNQTVTKHKGEEVLVTTTNYVVQNVKTGDDTMLTPYFVLAFVSGLILLVLAVLGMKKAMDKKKV